jgi:putative phage-type endonuclease
MKKKIPNISARDFAAILNINPYQTAFQLLESKIENKYPFFGNKFTDHGNRYESLALKVYETNSGNKVEANQPNCKHPEYDWITGRFDGIAKIKKRKRGDESRYCIVEIKCPLKNDRTEPLTLENIPKYYLSQCQVYMNMIDCDTAHYAEYYKEPDGPENSGKLYILEIKKDPEWWNDSLPKIQSFYKEMKKYHELGSLDTHPVRIIENEWYKNTILQPDI